MLCFLAALGQNGLDGLSLRPFSLATPRGGGLFAGQTNFPDFGAAWNPSSRDEGGSTDRDGGVERYQNGGFEDPPACSLLEPGLPRWLCGVVGQLPHIGLRISPADDPSTVLSLRIEGLMVSGLSVQDVHSAHHRTGNASLPPGFAAALDGIGFRVHLDSFEVSSSDCAVLGGLVSTCRSQPSAPLPGGAPSFTVTRADFDKVHHLALAPVIGAHLKAEGAALSVRLVVDGTAAYPPPLRVPHFGLELPPHGLSLSVWRETSLGFSLETDLQPFIALILSLLHDVLLEQVSTAVAESAVSESELFCEWVRQQMGPKQLGGDGSDFILSPPLPEPPSPYPRGDTLVWRDVAGGLLVTLNSERGLGGFSLQEAAAVTAGHLLGEHGKGQLRLPLWEVDLAQRIPTLTDPVVGASLRLAPAYLELGGLHTLNQLALAKPRGRSTEPYSLEFGLGFRELTVELRFNLSIALPEAGPDSLLYHAKSAPLAQQLKLSLSLSNLSASAIAFAPLSTDELFATPWLYLTPACLLRPLRVASLRQLLLSLSPDVIRLGEDPLYEIYRPEIEARLYGLVSDAIDFLDANYVSPDAIAALTSGPLLNMVNGLLPSAFDWLTGDCEPPPTPPPPPAPVEWCRAPLVQLAESELTARLVNTLFEALGLGDVSVHGAVSVPLDGAWLGPVTIEVSEPRLENLDQLSELKLLAADCAEPTTLRSTIGLGSAEKPLRISFVARVQLGCFSNGDRFGGKGCEWHEYNVTLSLAAVRLQLDLDVELLQPFPRPEAANASLACAALPLSAARLLPSTRLEIADWSDALLELEVHARGQPLPATVPTGWVYWLVSTLLPDGLDLGNDLVNRTLVKAHQACAGTLPPREAEAPEDHTFVKVCILLGIYGTAVLISGSIIGYHCACRPGERAAANDDVSTGLSLAREQPLWQSLLMSAVCVAIMAMFVYSQCNGALGNLFIHVSVAGDPLPVINGFNITVADTVLEIWSSGSPPLAILVGGMSGTWPYVKMTLTLFALWAPPRVLHADRRGAFLFFFDAFGKWSFFDVLLLQLLMAGFHLNFDVPTAQELPPGLCGSPTPLVGFATEVAPLELVSLFIVALMLSLIATNIVNHWHQVSVLESHRKYTAQLTSKIERTTLARQTSAQASARSAAPPAEEASPPLLAQLRSFSPFGRRPPQPDEAEKEVALGRIRTEPAPTSLRRSRTVEGHVRGSPRQSLARLSLAPAARQAEAVQRTLVAEAGGDEPAGGLRVHRLKLKTRHLQLVKWWLLGSIGLTLVAFFTTSFTISVEGLVGNIIDSQPGQSSHQSFSFFSMGDVLGESAPAIGGAVLQAHRYLFLILCGVMPVVWLSLCLIIWLVPMDPHTSHNFGLLAQVAYCYTGMDVLVVVIGATIFQLGAAIEFQFESQVWLLSSLIDRYFSEFVPETSRTHVHTTISLGAAFEIGIGLVVVASIVSTAAGWFVMYAHQRLLHEETFLFPVDGQEGLESSDPEDGEGGALGEHSSSQVADLRELPATGGLSRLRQGLSFGGSPQSGPSRAPSTTSTDDLAGMRQRVLL